MEQTLLIRTAAWLLGATALVGAGLAVLRFARDRRPPQLWSALHGVLATAGTAVLVYTWVTVGLPKVAAIALVLLLGAAAGGLVTSQAWRWKGAPPAELLVFGHLSIATTGLIMLVASALAPG